jgi:predicted DNA-binding WGR domain protein
MSTVYLTRKGENPRTGKQMARFYRMGLVPTLFGQWDMVREWGRIGSAGQVKATAFPDEPTARAAMHTVERLKRSRGYR